MSDLFSVLSVSKISVEIVLVVFNGGIVSSEFFKIGEVYVIFRKLLVISLPLGVMSVIIIQILKIGVVSGLFFVVLGKFRKVIVIFRVG